MKARLGFGFGFWGWESWSWIRERDFNDTFPPYPEGITVGEVTSLGDSMTGERTSIGEFCGRVERSSVCIVLYYKSVGTFV